MGFVSMNGGSQSSMLSMPVSEGVEDVGLDTLRQTGDEMQSSASIDDNATAFDLSIDQLREMAKMDNAVKTVKNAFFNFYPEKKIYYAAPPTFAIDTYGDSLVYNRFADPSEFLDPARLTMAVQLNTNDTATFNNDSLSAGVQSIDLYVPAPSYTVDVVAYNKLDTTAWLKGYWPEYISSDSARNRINNTGVSYYQGHPGHLSDSWQIDIAFWVGGLRSDFKAGPFIYKKNRTSIVASYDWSVALPFDNNGKPIIYIPTIEVSTTEAHQIDSITVKWFTYDPQQSTYIEVTDLTMLSRMISGLDINPWDNGPPRGVHFSDLTKPCVIRCATQYPAETIYASHTHTDTDIGKTFIGGITVQYQQLGVNMALNWWFK